MINTLKILSILIVIFSNNFLHAQSHSESDLPAKKDETKVSEVITTDSLPVSEILKRAVNWVKTESTLYGKTNGVTTGSKAECIVTFHIKPKELNPQCDYTGKITMKVVIECKPSKYRYTITHIQHISTGGSTSGGSIDNAIPDCGTMAIVTLTRKKLKGDALANAASVATKIKEKMKVSSADAEKDGW